jgi:hypothetical protein
LKKKRNVIYHSSWKFIERSRFTQEQGYVNKDGMCAVEIELQPKDISDEIGINYNKSTNESKKKTGMVGLTDCYFIAFVTLILLYRTKVPLVI